ncbi:MAG: hypothetical protein IIC35_00720, partial [Gemmatimonadetes bacterium]|nr:hypothetical protein [Gemmatimonadota bacterium]
MTAEAVPEVRVFAETANDRLKKTFSSWFWGSMIVATVAHFGIFSLWPQLVAEDVSFKAHELVTIRLPPDIE